MGHMGQLKSIVPQFVAECCEVGSLHTATAADLCAAFPNSLDPHVQASRHSPRYAREQILPLPRTRSVCSDLEPLPPPI